MEPTIYTPTGRPRHADIPLAMTEEELLRDYPFTGRIERFDEARGLWRFVEAKATPTKLSQIERRMRSGTYRLITEDAVGAELEIEFQIGPAETAAPSVTLASAPAEPGSSTLDRLLDETAQLRATRDAERARLLEEVDDWRRKYLALSEELAAERRSRGEDVRTATEDLRRELDAARAKLHKAELDAIEQRLRRELDPAALAAATERDVDEAETGGSTLQQVVSMLAPLAQTAGPAVAGWLASLQSGGAAAPAPPPMIATATAPLAPVPVAPPVALADAPASPVSVDDVLHRHALVALTAPNPDDEADARWAGAVGQLVERAAGAIDAGVLLRLLARLATDAVASNIVPTRVAKLAALLLDVFGLTKKVKPLVASSTVAMGLIDAQLDEAGITLSPDGRAVLKDALKALKPLV